MKTFIRSALALLIAAGVATGVAVGTGRAADDDGKGKPAQGLDAAGALKRLTDGNARYVSHKEKHPHLDEHRLKEVAKGQHPYATILTCADSRVSPELMFDEGLGDLFVIRVAGNVVDDVVLGSIEYGAAHLHTPVIMVLGHERCGAVGAAVKNVVEPGHISSLVTRILPAVRAAKKQEGDLVENSVRANVELVVGQIKAAEPVIAELVLAGKCKVVGARYDLDDGSVTIDPFDE